MSQNKEYKTAEALYEANSDHLDFGYGDIHYAVGYSDRQSTGKEYQIYLIDGGEIGFILSGLTFKQSVAEKVCEKLNRERISKFGDVSKLTKPIPDRLIQALESALNDFTESADPSSESTKIFRSAAYRVIEAGEKKTNRRATPSRKVHESLLLKLRRAIDNFDRAPGSPPEYIEVEVAEAVQQLKEIAALILKE